MMLNVMNFAKGKSRLMAIQIKEVESIKISAPETDEYIPSEQSANVLFNFMKQLKFLKISLKNKAFMPRYYEEKVDTYNIGIDKICFPMTCFCDIHLQRLGPHVKFYGFFGIGLEKKWGLKAGVQPIQYVNVNAPLIKTFSELFLKSLQNLDEEHPEINSYRNYLLTNLLYLKPLNGDMWRVDKYVPRNFHDEKEWRFVPDMSCQDDLDLLIPQSLLSPNVYEAYSMGITKCKDLWLTYEYEDIRYLVVETKNDRIELIKFISEELTEGIDHFEKTLLISKIIVWEDMKEDW
ncbi:hypothetical protein CN490_24855 [Bacillus cereus]|nr:hypothetical protein CN490_24855 [Bacillus cereus]